MIDEYIFLDDSDTETDEFWLITEYLRLSDDTSIADIGSTQDLQVPHIYDSDGEVVAPVAHTIALRTPKIAFVPRTLPRQNPCGAKKGEGSPEGCKRFPIKYNGLQIKYKLNTNRTYLNKVEDALHKLKTLLYN